MALALKLQHSITITVFYSVKVKMGNFSSHGVDVPLALKVCVYTGFPLGEACSLGLDKRIVTEP